MSINKSSLYSLLSVFGCDGLAKPEHDNQMLHAFRNVSECDGVASLHFGQHLILQPAFARHQQSISSRRAPDHHCQLVGFARYPPFPSISYLGSSLIVRDIYGISFSKRWSMHSYRLIVMYDIRCIHKHGTRDTSERIRIRGYHETQTIAQVFPEDVRVSSSLSLSTLLAFLLFPESTGFSDASQENGVSRAAAVGQWEDDD